MSKAYIPLTENEYSSLTESEYSELTLNSSVEELSNILLITQSASGITGNYVNANGDNSINFSSSIQGKIGKDVNNILLFNSTVQVIAIKKVNSSIVFNSTVHRTFIEDIQHSIVFEQTISQVYHGIDTITFTQEAEFEIVKKAIDSIVFDQVLDCMGVFNRGKIQSIIFNSFATAYKGSDNGYYPQPSPDNPNPPDPNNPDCTIKECTNSRVYFNTNIELRAPETVEKLINNAVETSTVAKEFKQVNRYNNYIQLDLSFSGIPKSMRDAFKQFYINTAGEEVTYTDECGDDWVGVIITDITDIEQNGNGFMCPNGSGVYNFDFTFEGVKV